MIDSLQYDLERAYHVYRQHTAAQLRFVAEVERQTVAAAASASASPSGTFLSRLRAALARSANTLKQPRRQIA